MIEGYEGLKVYYGDIHNHCGISYGHGTIEDAFANARLQLDFCSVTGHGYWPDMPRDEERLREIVRYHEEGFAKLRKGWERVKAVTEANNEEGKFVTFLSYEWHCMRSGDHTIIYKGSEGDIIPASTLSELKRALAEFRCRGVDAIVMPHHISYPKGYRGINWADFTSEFTPVVEIVSMHGCSESDDAPYPPLHTMGPRDHEGTAQYGLALGHIFGFVGNTDHHSAHPGSYGCGRTGVWAESLTRDGIWKAIQRRRTYALTGDRIELQFAIDGRPMGSLINQHTAERNIEIFVSGGGPIDYVELVKNNRAIHRVSATDREIPEPGEVIRTKLFIEVGWGKRIEQRWDVFFGIDRGRILAVEPRFRGEYVVAPKEGEEGEYHYSSWRREGERAVRFKTLTSGNPTVLTNASQGMMLEVEMPLEGKVMAELNGERVEYKLLELIEGGRAGFLGGFVTAAYRLHRAPMPEEYEWHITFQDIATRPRGYDFYYVRVCQKNGQWAWSSPIWVT
jgi:hypothetical protein